MRRFGKWFLIALGSMVALLAIVITLTIGWSPFFGPKARALTNRTFARTPQRLERGRYIATGLSGCIDCHTPHDWNAPGAPMLAGMSGGGDVLPYADLPGRIVASNLTPDPDTGAGSWTDDQLARAIREGVGHDGRALFPIMPYQRYRNMSYEDLASSAPEPIAAPVADVVSSDQLRYGTYLADQAACVDCHTPQVRGQNVSGMDFAGGFPFTGPWRTVASSNITPDPSGIPYYDEALFLDVMRTGQVRGRKLSPIMPVMVYKNLTDDDLKAIFAFLRRTKPVKHRIDNSEPPTECKVCKQKHGGGNENK